MLHQLAVRIKTCVVNLPEAESWTLFLPASLSCLKPEYKVRPGWQMKDDLCLTWDSPVLARSRPPASNCFPWKPQWSHADTPGLPRSHPQTHPRYQRRKRLKILGNKLRLILIIINFSQPTQNINILILSAGNVLVTLNIISLSHLRLVHLVIVIVIVTARVVSWIIALQLLILIELNIINFDPRCWNMKNMTADRVICRLTYIYSHSNTYFFQTAEKL